MNLNKVHLMNNLMVYDASIPLNLKHIEQLVGLIAPGFVLCDNNKCQPECHIANVAQKVVEVRQLARWEGALEVVVAQVQVACLRGLLLVLEDQLQGGDGVGDPHGDHQPDVHVIALEHGLHLANGSTT